MRKLAERSAQAAKEITSLIRASSRNVAEGTGAALQSIQAAISQSGDRMHAVGGQSLAQREDSSRVVAAMGSLAGIAEGNAGAT